MLIYWFARSVLISVAVRPGNGALMLDASVLVLAAALAFVTYGEIPAPVRLIARGIGVIVLIQLAFDAGNIFLGSAGADPVFFRFGTVLGLLAGMLALWRPAFLMPLFYHYVAFRHQIGVATGIGSPKPTISACSISARFWRSARWSRSSPRDDGRPCEHGRRSNIWSFAASPVR